MTATTPPGVGADGDRPPQGATALRERLAKVLHSKVTSPHPLADGLARRAADLVMPVVETALAERERQVREQVAAEIRALADQFGSANSLAMGAEAETLRWAADRIARKEAL